MTEIRTIGVVGAGTMGHGIARVASVSSFAVPLVDAGQPGRKSGRGFYSY